MKRRFNDVITIEPTGIETTPEGFLVIPARLTTTGVFTYSWGKVYRSPDEIGSYKSIKT